jgi:hypothetical protein
MIAWMMCGCGWIGVAETTAECGAMHLDCDVPVLENRELAVSHMAEEGVEKWRKEAKWMKEARA